MNMTHLLTIDETGADVRVPFDLTTGCTVGEDEPWTEPPLVAPLPHKRRYTTRQVVMTCNHCGYKKMQCARGTCHKCREGVMTHTEGKVKIIVRGQR